MAAGGVFVFKGDQEVGEKTGSLSRAAVDNGLMAFLTGSGVLSCCCLLPLGMGFCVAGGAQGRTWIKGMIFLNRVGVEQRGTRVGAMHFALEEMAIDAGDSLLLIKNSMFSFLSANLKGAVAFKAFLFWRVACGLLKGLADESLCVGCALPFSILFDMTCAALAGLRSSRAFRWGAGQVAEGRATGKQQRSEEQNNSHATGRKAFGVRHIARAFSEI